MTRDASAARSSTAERESSPAAIRGASRSSAAPPRSDAASSATARSASARFEKDAPVESSCRCRLPTSTPSMPKVSKARPSETVSSRIVSNLGSSRIVSRIVSERTPRAATESGSRRAATRQSNGATANACGAKRATLVVVGDAYAIAASALSPSSGSSSPTPSLARRGRAFRDPPPPSRRRPTRPIAPRSRPVRVDAKTRRTPRARR